MCGITGYFSNNSLEKIDLKLMNKSIAHRGPDNDGVYYDNQYNLGLGHRRLSIIDIEKRSNQPIRKNNIILSYNGEIYNYKDLIAEHLEDIVFDTTSDTEVLIELYCKFGIDKMLQIINGMFAFALIDKTENKMFLCRDKVGKKPLYYNISNDRIVFASEIKALENVLELVLDEEVFNDALYNRYSYNLSPYKGIELLNNGTYLEIDLKKFNIITKEYFRFEDLVDKNEYNRLNKMSVEMVAKELEQILEESIRIRMISDVPVGTINSGGLDSSLISDMVLEKNDIKMFHIDVEGDSELEYAQLLSDKLDKKLVIRTLKEEDFNRDLVNVIKHYEYPLVHPNAVGIYMLSRLAEQNNVKVLLSGDGADEIFGGYGFFLNELRSLKIPKSIKTIVGKLNNIVNGVTPPIYSKVFIQSSVRRKRIEQKYSFIENEKDRSMQVSLMNSLYEYLQVLNLRADKMGMSHSVEFRCPFLDINVMKFGVNLPLRFKIDGKNGKVILKKVADKRLPKKLIYRKKMGFPVPLVKGALVDFHWNTNQNYVLFSKSVLSDLKIKTEN